MENYKILKMGTVEKLVELVNKEDFKEWTPIGGVFSAGGLLHQVMVRKSPSVPLSEEPTNPEGGKRRKTRRRRV